MKYYIFSLFLLCAPLAAEAQNQDQRLCQNGTRVPPNEPCPEDGLRMCQDGQPAAEDGSCPEDETRLCDDGTAVPKAERCPEDPPEVQLVPMKEVMFEITSNVDLAVIIIDEREVGHTPFKDTVRLAEGLHDLAVVFPGFAMAQEEFWLNEDIMTKGVTRKMEIFPVDPIAKKLLERPKGVTRFLDSNLTIDGYVNYTSASKTKGWGKAIIASSLLSFVGMGAALLFAEEKNGAAVTLPFTYGTLGMILGIPIYGIGKYRVNKALKNKRDDEFQVKPVELEEPDNPDGDEPAPSSIPSSLPASQPESAPSSIPAS